MIGYHGAGNSNCAYMSKNSLLIEVFNKFYPHPHFELFCRVLKIRYKRFFCEKNFQNLDGFCDIKKVTNYLKKINNE